MKNPDFTELLERARTDDTLRVRIIFRSQIQAVAEAVLGSALNGKQYAQEIVIRSLGEIGEGISTQVGILEMIQKMGFAARETNSQQTADATGKAAEPQDTEEAESRPLPGMPLPPQPFTPHAKPEWWDRADPNKPEGAKHGPRYL